MKELSEFEFEFTKLVNISWARFRSNILQCHSKISKNLFSNFRINTSNQILFEVDWGECGTLQLNQSSCPEGMRVISVSEMIVDQSSNFMSLKTWTLNLLWFQYFRCSIALLRSVLVGNFLARSLMLNSSVPEASKSPWRPKRNRDLRLGDSREKEQTAS